MRSATPAPQNPSLLASSAIDVKTLFNSAPHHLQAHCLAMLSSKDEQTDNPLNAATLQLTKKRSARQLQAMIITIKIMNAISDFFQETQQQQPTTIQFSKAKDPNSAASQMRCFYDNVQADLLNYKNLAKLAMEKTDNLSNAGIDTIPHKIYVLWHILDEAEKQHQLRYVAKATQLIALFHQKEKHPLQALLDKSLRMLKKIYGFKKYLEYIDDVGLYLYRLNQYVTNKNKLLTFGVNWNLAENETPKISGFSEACEEYRKEFKKVMLIRRLNQCEAFETINQLNNLLNIQNTVKFTEPIQAEKTSNKICNIILSCLAELIENMTTPLSEAMVSALARNYQDVAKIANKPQADSISFLIDKDIKNGDNIIAFYFLIKSEQMLKDTLWLAQNIALGIKAKNSTEAVQEILPGILSTLLTKPMPSHEEVVADDKKRCKELEQLRREQHAQQEFQASEHLFAAQLRRENEQKQSEAAYAKRTALLEKINTLSSQQRRLLATFLDPDVTAHKKFDEQSICSLLKEIDVLEETTLGFKIKNNYTITSTHRSHNGVLDANFCRAVREIFADLNINTAILEAISSAKNSA